MTSALLPVSVTSRPALDRALLPRGVVPVADGPDEVVGLPRPPGGEGHRPGVAQAVEGVVLYRASGDPGPYKS